MNEPRIPRDIARLLQSATRHATPCGAGEMVWHAWGSGTPVVMLHGGSGSWTHWIRNVEAVVASGRMALLPDLPGFGDSASPARGADADADDVVEPLTAGLRQLAGGGPHEVVAFSFGSLVAALWAAQQPDSVKRLLLVGAPVVPLQRGRGIDLKPWARSAPLAERLAIHRHNLLAIMLHRERLIDDDLLMLQALNVERDRMRRRRLVTTGAFAQALRRLRCPYDAVYGEQDALFRDMWPEVRAALGANPRFGELTLMPGIGHWVQFEAAREFNELLARWLA